MLGRLWGCLASQSNGVLHCRKAWTFPYSSRAYLPAPGETSYLGLLPVFAQASQDMDILDMLTTPWKTRALIVRGFSAKSILLSKTGQPVGCCWAAQLLEVQLPIPGAGRWMHTGAPSTLCLLES